MVINCDCDIVCLLVCLYVICALKGKESLANAKVNARQHCVGLSCLCNSLTQIEWVADFSLGDEDSENIASKRYENLHLRRPLSCLTPHVSRTPANISITLISLETTFTGLHFRCWLYGSICIQIFVVGQNTRNHAKFRENSTLCSGLAESTERISRFLDRLAFAGLMWIIDVGTLRKDDDTVTTTQ